MKIIADQLNELQRQEQARNKTTAKPGAFQELLDNQTRATRQAGAAERVAAPPPGAGAMGIAPVQAAQEVQGVEHSPGAQEAMERDERVLDKWENYARRLGDTSDEQSLRNAYGELESIADDVRGLKQAAGELEGHAGLKSLVGELEVLAAAERFKFNRGDYQ